MKLSFSMILLMSIYLHFAYSQIADSNKDAIFDIIKSTKGYIFHQMRLMKSNFHPSIQQTFEKHIKEYEYRYLSNKEEFVEFLWDKYEELKQRSVLDDKDYRIDDNDLTNEIHEFLREFLSIFRNLSEKEKAEVMAKVEKGDEFTKSIIKYGMEKIEFFNDDNFNSMASIIEKLPGFLLNPNPNGNITNPIDTKINEDFDNFLNILHKEYNLHEITNATSASEKRQKIDNVTKNLQPKHKKWFSSFLEEYIHESVINNDDFKERYTMMKLNEMDLAKIKSMNGGDTNNANNNAMFANPENLIFQQKKYPTSKMKFRQYDDYQGDVSRKNFKDGMDRGKNKTEEKLKYDPPNAPKTRRKFTKEEKLDALGKKKEIRELALGKINEVMAKNHNRMAIDEIHNVLLLNRPCDQKSQDIEEAVNQKMEQIKFEKSQVVEELKDVPSEAIKVAGDPAASSQLALDIILKFIIKIIGLVIQHVPFYFFKICIPPGPLTFGCCPEAGFFPQQLYSIFTVLDKVEKFKTSAKGYPDWLSFNGHDDYSENRYYTCAQGFLTTQESSLFNFCNPISMIWTLPLNWQGKIPGDFPMCFWACLQTIITCEVGLDMIGPCDSLINLETIIKAIFDIPLRLRLVMTFGFTCTYIPFLIRWDLVPPWNKPITPEEPSGATSVPPSETIDREPDVAIKEGLDNVSCTDMTNPNRSPYLTDELRDLKPSPFETELGIPAHNSPSLIPTPPKDKKKRRRGKKVYKEKDDGRGLYREDKATTWLKRINKAYVDDLDYWGQPHKPDVFDDKEKYNKGKKKFYRIIDINYEFRMGQRYSEGESYADILAGYGDSTHKEKVYHIVTYGLDFSERRELDFPFQARRMVMRNWNDEEIKFKPKNEWNDYYPLQ